MTYSNCPHCGKMYSTRGLYKHIESKHPEYTKDFKHGFTIKITAGQREDLYKATTRYRLDFDRDVTITPEEYVVTVLQEYGVIR